MKEIFRCEKCDREFSTAEETRRHEENCNVFPLWGVLGRLGHYLSLWTTEQMAKEHIDEYTCVRKIYVNKDYLNKDNGEKQ